MPAVALFNEYQWSSIEQAGLALVLPIVASVIYWLQSQGLSWPVRIAVSAHGAGLVLAFAYAVWASRYSQDGSANPWMGGFYTLLAIYPLSAVAAWHILRPRVTLHLIQIPVVLCGLKLWFLGTMTIVHEWI